MSFSSSVIDLKNCFEIGANAGERKTNEEEETAGGIGATAAAIAVAGALLRARKRVDVHEHGGN